MNLMLIFFSFIKLLIVVLYYVSLLFGLSSFSWFFMWVCLEFNLFMYMFLFYKMSQSLVNSLMKYFIIQSLSSNLFLMSLIFIKYNFFCYYYFFFIIFVSMWMKIGFFPFSMWFFQISEGMEWKMWYFLNTFQKLMPLLVISKNFLSLMFFFFMVFINFIYCGLEMFIQSSFRWFINCSSMIHFTWILISIKSSLYVWQFYFFFYFIFFFILFKFLMNKNLKSYLNLFLLNNSESLIYLSVLLINFMGLPPFLGFFLKVLVLSVSNMYVLMMVLIMFSLLMLMVYFYYLSPLMMKLIFFSKLSLMKKINFFFIYSLFLIMFYFFMIMV